jgi:hypothetical protein
MRKLEIERKIKRMNKNEIISFLKSHNIEIIKGTERRLGTPAGNHAYIQHYKLNETVWGLHYDYMQSLRNDIDAMHRHITEVVTEADRAANRDIVGATAGLYSTDWDERDRLEREIENIEVKLAYVEGHEPENNVDLMWWEDAENYKYLKEVENYEI